MEFEISKKLAEGIIEAHETANYADGSVYYCEPMYDFMELLKKSFNLE